MVSIKFTEIKKAVNALLKERYPPEQYKIYGQDTREDYEEPCFFTEILDKGSSVETKNFAKGGFTLIITYFQEKKNELDQLEKIDEIKELFGLFFCVGNRKLTISNFSSDYIGEYQDILQIRVEIDYKENTQKADTAPIAAEIGVKVTQS